MKGILATLMRELRAYFFSPLAYVLLTFFLLVNGYVFWIIVSFLNNRPGGFGNPLELLFGQTIFFWLVLLFVTPMLTMRLISEERRSGTIEVLMTAPVSETQVVLGKFFGALCFYVFLWLPTLAYVFILARHIDVDWGPIASGYLGIVGIGCVFLAVGLFASSFSRSQLVAAFLGFMFLMLLFTFGLLESLVNDPALKEVFGYLDLWQHMDDFAKGIVETRRLVYYASTTALFLFLSARALELKKWR